MNGIVWFVKKSISQVCENLHMQIPFLFFVKIKIIKKRICVKSCHIFEKIAFLF